MNVVETVEAYCRQHSLFQPGETILIACSGGPDSLALLDILARLRPAYDLRLAVCYVHHGIREAADEEVPFVRQEAEKRACPFICRRTDVPALAAQERASLEAVGRRERYRLLREEKDRLGAAAIAVAHHQDDQAETVLLHLLRGSGLAGLGAMRPQAGDVVRPLLGITRGEIDAYVKERNLTPRHDETNDSVQFTRNRIRLELLPALRQYNPSVVGDLNRLAQIAQAEDDCMAQWASRLYEAHVRPCPGGAGVEKKWFLSQPAALQRRLVRLLCRNATGTERDIPFHYVETIRELACKGAGKQFQTGRVTAYTTKSDLCVVVSQGIKGRRRTKS
ncbi:tRNA lysidine(34) synthetase TilS [Megasphaera sp. ASD88]|uniref:tRNA lysidine(34) synthetase TilS n=1 Tax=Megasphaera sp. ASD88 TaxID=2027407 RepID=UPI000BAB989D|nr:tRNA lysidine(34) synthetase TilS [Megasphaera sp. ASD88]PAV39535.1 tRNA lysidine(34) synthetase TilS [Megasphaera sp. ASD88]